MICLQLIKSGVSSRDNTMKRLLLENHRSEHDYKVMQLVAVNKLSNNMNKVWISLSWIKVVWMCLNTC